MTSRRSLSISLLSCAAVVVAAAVAGRAPLAQATGYDALFFKALQWRNVGPVRGGRSIASAGSPSRRDEYFFGAVGGGLWKTTDGGQTWSPVTDGQIRSSSVGAVAVAETNPDIVFVAAFGHPSAPNAERGVFKSVDGGKTWKKTLFRDDKTAAIDLAI